MEEEYTIACWSDDGFYYVPYEYWNGTTDIKKLAEWVLARRSQRMLIIKASQKDKGNFNI